jgi:hypothetical protein
MQRTPPTQFCAAKKRQKKLFSQFGYVTVRQSPQTTPPQFRQKKKKKKKVVYLIRYPSAADELQA